jgi:predicted transcriptional regulator
MIDRGTSVKDVAELVGISPAKVNEYLVECPQPPAAESLLDRSLGRNGDNAIPEAGGG